MVFPNVQRKPELTSTINKYNPIVQQTKETSMVCHEQEFLTKEVFWVLIPTLLQMASVMGLTVCTKSGTSFIQNSKKPAGTLNLKENTASCF